MTGLSGYIPTCNVRQDVVAPPLACCSRCSWLAPLPSPARSQQLACMFARGRRNLRPADHASQFLDSPGLIQFADPCLCASSGNLLGYSEVSRSIACDLGLMSHTENLIRARESLQSGSDGIRYPASDTCINLIKDQRPGKVGRCSNRLEGKHGSRKLAARSDSAQRTRVLAGVCGKKEVQCLVARPAQARARGRLDASPGLIDDC